MVINPTTAMLIVIFVSGVAELLHAARCRSVNRLAFGPVGRPRRWTIAVPLLRIASLGALTWGLGTLLNVDAKKFEEVEVPVDEMHRIIIAYDVSPSMYLKDAGPLRDEAGLFVPYGSTLTDSADDTYQVKIERYVGADGSIMRKPTTRARRAAELLHSILDRIKMQQVLVSVVAFYTGEARTVLADCQDIRSIRNIFDDLPLKYAFQSGKTDVVSGIEGAAEMAKDWPPESTTLLVITDGGTGSLEDMPVLPESINNTIVVGVGKTGQGLLLDGDYSRQESTYLGNLARRLNGTYYDGNEKHVPLESFESLAMDLSEGADWEPANREYAIAAISLGGFSMGFLPVLLAAWGSSWRVRERRRKGGTS